MGKINSKKKGSRGELEFAHECEKYGFNDVARSAQLTGKVEGASADCEGLEDIHIEVKRVEKLNIYTAIEQSTRDSKIQNKNNIPVVFYRKNRKPWLASMTLDNWFKLYQGYLNNKSNNKLDKD